MTSKVTTLNETTFHENLNKDITFVVRLWAPWCMPCRMMAPFYTEVAQKVTNDALVMGEINIDAYPAIAAQLGVRSIPTVVIFKHGQEAERHAGLLSAQQLEEFVLNVR